MTGAVRSLLLAGAIALGSGCEPTAALTPLEQRIAAIDADTPGELGVYIHQLGSGERARDDAGRRWYMASTVKVPVAIAVLEAVDAGELSLDETLVLAESDFVDGAGDLIWHEPGARFSIATLLEKSLVDSDSTATDMLIRRIGVERLNRRLQQWVPDGFGELTTILQVRYDVYGLMHPHVASLSNMQLVALKRAQAGTPRRDALLRALGVTVDDLQIRTIDEAFARYYASGRNSATLDAIGRLLERLARGELLSSQGTARMLDLMQRITTGDRRIKAGLPDGVRFAQKTGTQHARACNIGLLLPERPEHRAQATAVAACIEDFGALAQAERAFRGIGEALAQAGLVPE